MLIFRSPLSTSTPPSPVTASSAWCFCHSDSSQNVQNNQPLFPRSGPHRSLRNKIHAQPSPGLKVEHTLCLFWLKSQTKCKLFSNSFLNDFQIFCSYFYYLFWLIFLTHFSCFLLQWANARPPPSYVVTFATLFDFEYVFRSKVSFCCQSIGIHQLIGTNNWKANHNQNQLRLSSIFFHRRFPNSNFIHFCFILQFLWPCSRT